MNEQYMIQLDDYIQHIDDKLELYAMLRQLEDVIGQLPVCKSTKEVQTCMAAFSPRLEELWARWNIPARYLLSGETGDLEDVMAQELRPVEDPEDAGDSGIYYSYDDYDEANTPHDPALQDHELLLALVDTADKLYNNYSALIALAKAQMERCAED